MKKTYFETYCVNTEQKYLIEEWDYEKNKELSPNSISKSSRQVVWWKCRVCGYEWSTQLVSRVNGLTGCPNCYKKKQEERRKLRAKKK